MSKSTRMVIISLLNAKAIKRQEDIANKQKEIREKMERQRREEIEAKAAARKARAKKAARDRSGSPVQRRHREEVRGSSPPIPTMRNRDQVANGFSEMREQLDKKQEEHEAVWNGLVEV